VAASPASAATDRLKAWPETASFQAREPPNPPKTVSRPDSAAAPEKHRGSPFPGRIGFTLGLGSVKTAHDEGKGFISHKDLLVYPPKMGR